MQKNEKKIGLPVESWNNGTVGELSRGNEGDHECCHSKKAMIKIGRI
jgi:hypothetical protein